MGKLILHILVILLWTVAANATVSEFNSDGSVTTYEARDYLAEMRHSRKKPKVSLSSTNRKPKGNFSEYVEAASLKYGIDSKIIHAVIKIESYYQPDALSPKGAQGLMQLMPDTAKQYGVTDAFDQNKTSMEEPDI